MRSRLSVVCFDWQRRLWRCLAQVMTRIPGEDLGHEFACLRVVRVEAHERVIPPFATKGVHTLRPNQLAIVGARHFIVGSALGRVRGIWSAVKNEGGDSVGQTQGQIQRDARPLRHSEHNRVADLQVIKQFREVVEILRKRRAARRQAEAATVVADDATRAAQLECLRLPHLEVERPAVNQDQRTAMALIAIAQARAANRDVLIECLHRSMSGVDRTLRLQNSYTEKYFAIRLRTWRRPVKRPFRPGR